MPAGGADAADLLPVNPLFDRRVTDVKLYGCVARFQQFFCRRRWKLAVPGHLEGNRTVGERRGSNDAVAQYRARALKWLLEAGVVIDG